LFGDETVTGRPATSTVSTSPLGTGARYAAGTVPGVPRPGGLLRTAVLAGFLSGAPSTLVALVRGDDALAATRAAGTLLPGRRDRPGVVAGVITHAVLTVWWTAVLTAVLRRLRGGAVAGAAGGAAIAALDLGVLARRYPAIRALPQLPQWADHLAFGAVVGAASGRLG
jgi:hypothetical protein